MHFSVEVRKIKKYSSEKNSLSLRKRNFLALIFKTLLYFLKRNLFLYFGKWNPELLIPSSKSKKSSPRKYSYIFGNGNFEESLYISGNRTIFPELCYISGYMLYFRKYVIYQEVTFQVKKIKRTHSEKTFYISRNGTSIQKEASIQLH